MYSHFIQYLYFCEMADNLPISFLVGETIRVISIDRLSSFKGIIACVNNTNSYDIVYQRPLNGKEEEDNVASERISKLLEFETLSFATNGTAEESKEHGNILFGLKDYYSADECYEKGCNIIQSQNYKIGSQVIVMPANAMTNVQNKLRTGIISEIVKDGFDIIFDDESQDEVIIKSRLLLIEKDEDKNILQRSLYMNRARCAMKNEKKGWAIHWVSLAIAMLHSNVDVTAPSPPPPSTRKAFADCYFMRSSILLQANRPFLAKKVYTNLTA